MRVIYSSDDFGHCGGKENPYTVDLDTKDKMDLEIPSCGWIKFEVKNMWITVEISEWGNVVIETK